jgi:hypothetical protein
MKTARILLVALVYLTLAPMAQAENLYRAGTVFIRQKTQDLKVYRDVFVAQKDSLKAHGFFAYSLHRDLNDPKTMIVTLKCINMKEGVRFIHSAEFMQAMDKAHVQIPQVWYGLDLTRWKKLQLTPKKYTDQPHMTGGIVIARNEVRDYSFWLDCFYQEDGGKHDHPGRQYKNSNYNIEHLLGDPAVAIVTHEASDVSKAPIFMASEAMKGEMESTGVIGLEVWFGINLEEGLF